MTGVASGAPAPPAVAGIDRAPFEEFLIHEARLLDERRFRGWMELFAEDGTYWVPAVPDQASPFDQASLFYDDRELMKTRVERLEHPRIHVQTPPSREAQRLFAGRQRHRLRRDGTRLRIVEKRVDLINCDCAFEAIAVPI
jgi:benzoate/toluate 1,2-dioxygenase beta subunit